MQILELSSWWEYMADGRPLLVMLSLGFNSQQFPPNFRTCLWEDLVLWKCLVLSASYQVVIHYSATYSKVQGQIKATTATGDDDNERRDICGCVPLNGKDDACRWYFKLLLFHGFYLLSCFDSTPLFCAWWYRYC